MIATVLAPVLWLSSPHLRDFTLQSVADVRDYLKSDAVTSSGLHLEFLKKSIGIIEDAPLIGHGTGSIPEQFRLAAAGETGAAAIASVNPHNQIFAVAIQLGWLGAIVLVAMWLAHFLLFRGGGWTSWAGMVVVVENVISSTVNSHLFDFSQGWLYVFGVGVAGGIALKGIDAQYFAANGQADMMRCHGAANAGASNVRDFSIAARRRRELRLASRTSSILQGCIRCAQR